MTGWDSPSAQLIPLTWSSDIILEMSEGYLDLGHFDRL